MLSPSRITLPNGPAAIERLRQLTEIHNLSQPKVITCLLNMPDEDIKKAIEDNIKLISQRNVTARRKQLRAAIKDMNSDDIEALLEFARKSKAMGAE